MGDFLIHCGDFTVFGEPHEIESFLTWFTSFPHRHKILIAGNHEAGLCPRQFNQAIELNNQVFMERHIRALEIMESFNDKVHYLENSGVELDGIKFWGSPVCGGDRMVMRRWGFFYPMREQRRKKWALIPSDTNVLITHTPPFGILDVYNNRHLGCEELLERVKQVRPRLHCFGHIHEAKGRWNDRETGTLYVNAAMEVDGKIRNKPTVFEYDGISRWQALLQQIRNRFRTV